jgi:hypothetical protein
MAERDLFCEIIEELFQLVKKDDVNILTLYPLNKKKGSFPVSLMARIMLYYLDYWVQQNEEDKAFRLNSINIVCPNHPTVSSALKAGPSILQGIVGHGRRPHDRRL